MRGRATAGLHGVTLHLPDDRVDLGRWCTWTGSDPAKVLSTVGSSFRMPRSHRETCRMAAEAALALVDRGLLQPDQVGFLVLATESSLDNAVGPVLMMEVLEEGLRQRGHPGLPRNCEALEVKQACLAAMLGVSAAMRYLALEGPGRQALVVATDIALYNEGSTGEPTQGAGAVAMVLRHDPGLLEIDPGSWAATTRWREGDFRKPLFGAPGFGVPVFNGPWSTVCYLDETLRALQALADHLGETVGDLLRKAALVLAHRPYRKMPRDAMTLWCLHAFPREREAVAKRMGISGDELASLLARSPSGPEDPWEEVRQAIRVARGLPDLARLVSRRMDPGEAMMSHCGNLYAGALPAWIGAALEEVARGKADLRGRPVLLVGYGSGNGAMAFRARVAPRWRETIGRCRLSEALVSASDLTGEAYRERHRRLCAGE